MLNKKSDLSEIVKYVENFIPEKDDSKTAHESLSFYLFLIAAFKIQKLTFPVEILKVENESPDFRLSRINEEPYLGIEHTRATVEKYKMDESELAKYPEGTHLEVEYYSVNDSPPEKSNISIKKPGKPFKHPGYCDYGIEKQWTEIILHSLAKKTQGLNTKKFKKYKRNELLIEDDSPAPLLLYRLNDAIMILKKTQAQIKLKESLTYDKVHICSCHSLIYDVFGETNIVSVYVSQLMKYLRLCGTFRLV